MNDYDKVLDSIRTVRDERDALRVRCTTLIELLREVEFTHDMSYGMICPCCGQTEVEGHSPTCKMDAALKAAKDGEG